jgi:hypothetical protein
MTSDSWIWSELRDFFDTDDGSLPEVRVSYAKHDAAATGYSLLRALAKCVVSAEVYVSTMDGDVPLDAVPNAAELVAAGGADPFHVVLGGITIRGETIPDLGVLVFRDQLALDYRMGSAWNAPRLEAFLTLLGQLVELDTSASIEPWPVGRPGEAERFVRAFESWRSYESA